MVLYADAIWAICWPGSQWAITTASVSTACTYLCLRGYQPANGDEVVLRSGKLSAAIRASMAIPGVFTPVVMEGKTLVDGGLCNNFPVDVARRMGADIVIGSTVQRVFNDTMQQGGIQSVVQQLISISSRRKFEENIQLCNLHIGVNPKGVSTMDFSPEKLDTMIRRGYETARQHQRTLQQIALATGVHFPYDPKLRFPGQTPGASSVRLPADTLCSPHSAALASALPKLQGSTPPGQQVAKEACSPIFK